MPGGDGAPSKVAPPALHSVGSPTAWQHVPCGMSLVKKFQRPANRLTALNARPKGRRVALCYASPPGLGKETLSLVCG
jgi:hypothetical protein